MSSKKVSKKEETKLKIISGSGHQTHYTNSRIEPKRYAINLCNCAIKCVNFIQNQLIAQNSKRTKLIPQFISNSF
jgi:hypothetical protein